MQLVLRSVPIAALLFAAQAQADVLTVEQAPTPGADFSEIQPAIDAAQEGDVIVVRTGTFYAGFTIDAKSLSVVAADGAHVPIWGDVIVRNLAASQSATLDGLFISVLSGATILDADDNAGPVLVQDTLLRTNSVMAFGSGQGAQIDNCANVTFVDSTVQIGFPWVGAVQDGIRAENSFVAFYGGSLDGGHGGLTGLNGGPGIRLVSSELLVSGAMLGGGHGGNTFGAACEDAGDGGTGIVLEGGSTVWRQEATISGGPAGLSDGPCTDGAPGADFEAVAGTVTTLSSPATTLAANSPVTVGSTLDLEITAEPGDTAWLLASTTLVASGFLSAVDGSLLLFPAGLTVVPLGVVPASGTIALSIPINSVPGNELELGIQALIESSTHGFLVSNGRLAPLLQ